MGFLGCGHRAGDRLDLLATVEPIENGRPPTNRRRCRPPPEDAGEPAGLPETPEAESLVAAADQFLVRRASTDGPTVIAGYHWFGIGAATR